MLQDIYCNTPAIILAHGYVGEILGKSVHGILMHSTVFDTVALIDKHKVGQDTSKICPGVTKTVPIFNDIKKTFLLKPKVMILIGDPDITNLNDIKSCITHKLDIINSSFKFLKDLPELVNLAEENNVKLIDLRDVPRVGRWPDGSISNIKAKVIYVTGTDCGLGKRTAAVELVREAKKRGLKAAFAATGQTGIMIGCDDGIIFDAISTNYSAGAVEKLIVDLDKKGFDLIFLEGQASLMHYGGSTVLTLLHASNPHAVVLVHDPKRKYHAAYGNSEIFKMCEINREIKLIESLYLPGGNKYNVVAVCTIGKENIRTIEKEINLPVADVRKENGPAIILNAILKNLYKENVIISNIIPNKDLLYIQN